MVVARFRVYFENVQFFWTLCYSKNMQQINGTGVKDSYEPPCVLGIKLRSSARSIDAFYFKAISPATTLLFLIICIRVCLSVVCAHDYSAHGGQERVLCPWTWSYSSFIMR